MSIAYGGIIAFLFRGVNLAVALGIVLFSTNQMGASNYGAFVLGLTVVGFVNAATGGLTAATAYRGPTQRQPPPVALLNGGILSVSLGAMAIGTGLFAGQVLAGGDRGGRQGGGAPGA